MPDYIISGIGRLARTTCPDEPDNINGAPLAQSQRRRIDLAFSMRNPMAAAVVVQEPGNHLVLPVARSLLRIGMRRFCAEPGGMIAAFPATWHDEPAWLVIDYVRAISCCRLPQQGTILLDRQVVAEYHWRTNALVSPRRESIVLRRELNDALLSLQLDGA